MFKNTKDHILNYRIGQGFDTHRLKENIPLIIGGVAIPYHMGSKGHSDGDVLFHALVDAILGALAQGDIGEHFPSDGPRWKNANSKLFLKYTYGLMEEKGYSVENVDSTIILQEPFLKPHIPAMRENTASLLFTDISRISIKATTTDKMGFIGKGEGIASIVSVLLKK